MRREASLPSSSREAIPLRLWRALGRLADAVEAAPMGPGLWIASFLALVAVRNLLELLSAGLPLYRPAALLVHYPLAYLAPALSLALILSALSGHPVDRVTRLMLPAAALILAPPLVDLALPAVAVLPGLPEGLAGSLRDHSEAPKVIGYLYDETGRGFLATLSRFLDPRIPLEGTTAGIRLEAVAAALAGGTYVLLRRGGLVRALLTLPAVLVTALFFFTLPDRFLGLIRVLRPGATRRSLYGSAGLLEGPGSVHDGVSILYLTVLVLLLLILWVFARDGRAGLRSGPLALAWSRGLLLAALAGIGMAAGILTRTGLEPHLGISLFDRLAMAGAILSALLIGAALGTGSPARNPSALVALAGGLCLALSTGYPGLAVALALSGAAWLAGPALPGLWASRTLSAIAAGAAGLAAVGFGYTALAGEQSLTWIPGRLLLGGALCGLSLAVAAADPVRDSRRMAAARAAASVVPVLVWPLLLAPPGPVVAVTAVFFGGAALAVGAGLSGGSGGLQRSALALAALLSALLGLVSQPVRADLARHVLGQPAYQLRRGDELRKIDALREAEDAYEIARTLAPDDAQPPLRLGQLEVARMERLAAAMGLEAVRSHPPARETLQEELQDSLRTAAGWFREALRKDPDLVPAHYNLGTALFQLGDAAAAEASFAAALELSPDHPGALLQRAEALQRLGRVEEAIATIQEYLRLTEADPTQEASVRRARELLRVIRLGRGSAGEAP